MFFQSCFIIVRRVVHPDFILSLNSTDFMQYRKISLPTLEERSLTESITDSACSTLRLVVNKACQLRCSWCYQEGMDHNSVKPILTPDTFIRIGDIAAENGFSKMTFSGGEPLLYPDLFRVQAAAAANGMKTYVTTNAVSIDGSDAVEQWNNIPNHEVHVSVNTLDEEEYRKITGRHLLKHALKGISLLRDAHIPMKINTVVSSPNDWPRVKRVIDFAGEQETVVKLLGTHDTDSLFHQKEVAEMLLSHGAEHIATSATGDVNYGYEQFLVDKTRVHVLDMLYGGGCCDRFFSGQCGEGVRYPRITYSGDIRPCLHKSIGKISNESSDSEIRDLLIKSQRFIRNTARVPFFLDPIK